MEYSQTFLLQFPEGKGKCLNPYSNGILTNNIQVTGEIAKENVLILILMEYSQTIEKLWDEKPKKRLNPYSNGILTNN